MHEGWQGCDMGCVTGLGRVICCETVGGKCALAWFVDLVLG